MGVFSGGGGEGGIWAGVLGGIGATGRLEWGGGGLGDVVGWGDGDRGLLDSSP